MKKLITLTAIVLASSVSTGVMAYGSGGSMGGSPSLSAEQLEVRWNGHAGYQNTPIAGILAGWRADVCGTLNGDVVDANNCGEDTPFVKRGMTPPEKCVSVETHTK